MVVLVDENKIYKYIYISMFFFVYNFSTNGVVLKFKVYKRLVIMIICLFFIHVSL